MTKTKPKAPPDTVISLVLPATGGIIRTATISARRGDLAAVNRFQYANLTELAQAIRTITIQLNTLELNPPSVPASTAQAQQAEHTQTEEIEPEIDNEEIDLGSGVEAEEWETQDAIPAPVDEEPIPDPLDVMGDPVAELLEPPPTHLPPGSATQQLEMF